MKVVSTEALTKLIQLVKSAFIKVDDTVQTNEITLATVATTGDYNDLTNKPTTRNVGEIIESALPLTDAGLHLLDGSLILGGGIYDEFVQYVAGLVSTYPACFTTEATWQQSVNDYGVCGKFVYDSVNNTVRLPKITGIVEGTTDLTALGDLVEAGLPNITGSANISGPWNSGTTEADAQANNSAIWTPSSSRNVPNGSSSTTSVDSIRINASYANPIYGNSTTVQPQTIKVLYYIVIASSVKTAIEVDIDKIATDLNGKADKDLSNATTGAFENVVAQAQTGGKETVIGWGAPDYTSKVSVTTTVSSTFTCPCNGYIIIRLYGYPNVAKLYYDSSLDNLGKEHRYGAIVAGNLGTCIYEYKVQKNEVLTCTTSEGHTRVCEFIPCKGEN